MNNIYNAIRENKELGYGELYDLFQYFKKEKQIKHIENFILNFKATKKRDQYLEDSLGSFDKEKNTLILNPNRIRSHYETDRNDIFNLDLIMVLCHELTHAVQYQKIAENRNSLESKFFADCFKEMKKDQMNYFMFHDFFPTEYNANIISYLDTYRLYNEFGFINNNNIRFYTNLANAFIEEYYGIGNSNVPNPILDEKTFKKYKNITELEYEKKLLTGFPLNNISELSETEVKTLALKKYR